MNQKELSELKRRFRPDKSAIHRIYGCFVNGNQEIVSYLDESMGRMPEEESAQYLGFLKKALSGTLGKQLIDIVFSTQQVADSPEHKLLSALRDSQLKDAQARETFYHKIIDALELDGNYLILLAHDAYDVPRRGKDDRLQEDSDTVFSYLVCCVCPVKDSKVELGYFPGENEFHSRAGQVVAPPELGFLFPAFDGRAANLYNALFYSKKADQIHQEFIDAVFHTEPPMSAAEQKASNAARCSSLGRTSVNAGTSSSASILGSTAPTRAASAGPIAALPRLPRPAPLLRARFAMQPPFNTSTYAAHLTAQPLTQKRSNLELISEPAGK